MSTVLESVREAGVGYRLLNLLAFYRATVGQLAGLDSPVLEALSECRKNADDTFRHAMKREVRSVGGFGPGPPARHREAAVYDARFCLRAVCCCVYQH